MNGGSGMDAGAWVALGAAMVALGAMTVAIWQAYEARRTRAATEEQAEVAKAALAESREQTRLAKDANTSAWLAADATDKTSKEAQRANDLTRQQQERENADRDERDGPEFDLTARRRRTGVHPVVVTMVSGPGTVAVNASYVGESASPSADDVVFGSTEDVYGGFQVENTGPHQMVTGSSFELGVRVPEPDQSIAVVVHLECTEVNGRGRSWSRSKSITLKRPPRPPTILR